MKVSLDDREMNPGVLHANVSAISIHVLGEDDESLVANRLEERNDDFKSGRVKVNLNLHLIDKSCFFRLHEGRDRQPFCSFCVDLERGDSFSCVSETSLDLVDWKERLAVGKSGDVRRNSPVMKLHVGKKRRDEFVVTSAIKRRIKQEESAVGESSGEIKVKHTLGFVVDSDRIDDAIVSESSESRSVADILGSVISNKGDFLLGGTVPDGFKEVVKKGVLFVVSLDLRAGFDLLIVFVFDGRSFLVDLLVLSLDLLETRIVVGPCRRRRNLSHDDGRSGRFAFRQLFDLSVDD